MIVFVIIDHSIVCDKDLFKLFVYEQALRMNIKAKEFKQYYHWS